MSNYLIVKDWLVASSLISESLITLGVYREPDRDSRGVCIIPTGGNLPSEVNNEILASMYFFSTEGDDIEAAQQQVIDVIEYARCNYAFNEYNVQATTPLTQPIMTNGNRLIWEIGFRVL